MDTRPILIRIPVSHFSKKVAWGLAHAGIRYDTRDVWFRELVDFRHVNPGNTVPVLEMDGQLICGSHTIMAWIAQVAPDANLYPHPEVAEREAWLDAVIGTWAQRVAYRTLHARPWRYSHNPGYWLAGLVAKRLTLAVLKSYKARRFDDSDAAEGAARLTKAADPLRDGRPYLFGDQPTAADFAQAALIEPILRARDTLSNHPDRRLLWSHVKRVRPRSTRVQRRRASKADHARWAAMPKVE